LSIKTVIKIVAATCYILRLKCTKFDFGWTPPHTQLGELTALPKPPSWIQGVPLLSEREGKKKTKKENKRKVGQERGENERKRRRKGERGIFPPWLRPRSATGLGSG